jgi:hypothetical protein
MHSSPVVGRGLKIAYPIFLEAEYKKQLLRLVDNLQRLSTEHILNNFTPPSSLVGAVRNDDIVDDLEYHLRNLNAAIAVHTSKVVRSLSRHFRSAQKFTRLSFNNSLAHVIDKSTIAELDLFPVAVPTADINLLRKMWVDKNTRLIKSIPAESITHAKELIHEAVRSGESAQSLSVKLNDSCFEISKKRAKVIARDQITKLKGDLSRYNDLSHGVTTYEWSTCKDGVVRVSHEVMQGKICSWLDASVYKDKITDKWKKRSSIGGVQKHVGADIMCRCTNIILRERLQYAG